MTATLYDHLIYHLDAVADKDPQVQSEMVDLFADQAWMHMRVESSAYRYDGYVTDLMTVWRRLTPHGEQPAPYTMGSDQLAMAVRFALIRTSINSLAANYTPVLVARAVETRHPEWSLDRAIDVANRSTDLVHRCDVLQALLTIDWLDDNSRAELRRQALAAASAISDEDSRARSVVCPGSTPLRRNAAAGVGPGAGCRHQGSRHQG